MDKRKSMLRSLFVVTTFVLLPASALAAEPPVEVPVANVASDNESEDQNGEDPLSYSNASRQITTKKSAVQEYPEGNINQYWLFSGRPLSGPFREHIFVQVIPVSGMCKAFNDKYSAAYGNITIGSVFPMVGCLYCFNKMTSRVVVTQLDENEYPENINLRKDAYIFPLLSSRHSVALYSGRLNRCEMLVGEIASDDNGTKFAKVAIDTPKENNLWRKMKDIDWQVVRVGDVLDFDGKRHRIVNIVPPSEKPFTALDRQCKLIGWIEVACKEEER